MSLETAQKPPVQTANKVWDLAYQCSTTVWHISPHETVSWPIEGRGNNSQPRSYQLYHRYYLTPEGIGIKRRYWNGRRYISVIGKQAFETTVDPSILPKLNAELERRKGDDLKAYGRDTLRKTEEEKGDEAIQLLEA